jgi:hypothetical protein
MFLNQSTLMNLATMGLAGLAVPNKAKFTDVSSGITTAVIIILIIIFIVWIMLLMATYKLTDSGAHTVLCALFGAFYLAFAFIYYGFSGYKFVKRS